MSPSDIIFPVKGKNCKITLFLLLLRLTLNCPMLNKRS